MSHDLTNPTTVRSEEAHSLELLDGMPGVPQKK